MATQTAQATFNGTQDFVDVTWTAMPGNFGIAEGVTISDSEGPVQVWYTNRSATGARVNTSDRFSGTVDLVIFDRP